jgi:hypothetical protein
LGLRLSTPVATVLAQVELLDSAGLPGTGVEHAQAVAPDAAAELFNALIMKPGSDVKKDIYVFRRTDGTRDRMACEMCEDVSATGCDGSVADVTAAAQVAQIVL